MNEQEEKKGLEDATGLKPAPQAAPEAKDSQVAAPAVTEAAGEPDLSDTCAKIEAWFSRHIHDSPVSRNTEVYNHVRAAVDALKKELSD